MKDRLALKLEALARDGKHLRYGVLARELQIPIAVLTAALETLMEADAAAGRPFRAALCAGRQDGGLPAAGFYLKAAALGRDVSDPDAMVMAERAALFAAARND